MIDYLKWLFNFKCKHERVRGIYGDEIIAANWHCGSCLDCQKLFKSLPPEDKCWVPSWYFEFGYRPNP